ncbi:hypothetical protein GY45DRAFT_269824 [Cubamyces sp. BRFM 1775]|nr:hypothetical protein GY45DRAFT_269824 [Cubamyces sp. BRFM 1775]
MRDNFVVCRCLGIGVGHDYRLMSADSSTLLTVLLCLVSATCCISYHRVSTSTRMYAV